MSARLVVPLAVSVVAAACSSTDDRATPATTSATTSADTGQDRQADAPEGSTSGTDSGNETTDGVTTGDVAKDDVTTGDVTTVDVNEAAASTSVVGDGASAAPAELVLPQRDGPRRQTSQSVPHVQLDASPVPELDAELRRRIFSLPGIEDRPSDRSLPGARGLAVVDHSQLERPNVIAGSQEFAHVHPDGSLHVWTSVPSAEEIEAKAWGELHPWVDRDGFWPGVTMVFTPETPEEVDVVADIVVDAYNYVYGADLTGTDIP